MLPPRAPSCLGTQVCSHKAAIFLPASIEYTKLYLAHTNNPSTFLYFANLNLSTASHQRERPISVNIEQPILPRCRSRRRRVTVFLFCLVVHSAMLTLSMTWCRRRVFLGLQCIASFCGRAFNCKTSYENTFLTWLKITCAACPVRGI